MKRELIHTRKITVNCYETKEELLIIEGSLTDERFFPYVINVLDVKHDPGLIHQITATMELSIPTLKIHSMKAEMPVVPDEGCREIKDAIQKLAGRSIRPGFTNEVRKILGRVSGCLHLTNLILSMSSAAVQGVWSYYSREREGRPAPPTSGGDGSMLLNSCYMWRENGPFLEKIRRRNAVEHEKGG
ncbi:MAG: DUF2889 domain-containing protein [Syntrophales bacterium]